MPILFGSKDIKRIYYHDDLVYSKKVTKTIDTNVNISNAKFVYGKGIILGTTGDATNREIYSIDNGKTWNLSAGPAGAFNYCSPTYGNGKFVSTEVGSSDKVFVSNDGYAWTTITAFPSVYARQNMIFENGQFVVATEQAEPAGIYTSPDGLTWTPRTTPTTSYRYGLAYGNGRYVCITGSSFAYYSTDNGVTWSQSGANGLTSGRRIAFGNGRFVATNYNDATNDSSWSTDGVTWNPTGKNLPHGTHGITFGDGWFVTTTPYNGGEYDKIYYSADGVTWKPFVYGDNIASVSDIMFFNHLFCFHGSGANAKIFLIDSKDFV